MNNKYVQQFKKGSLEMILLCLIGRKETYGYEIITKLNNSASVLGYSERGNHLPHFVSFAGSRTNQMPIGSGCGKWRLKKVLFFNG